LDYHIVESPSQGAPARWNLPTRGIAEEFHSPRIMLEVWKDMNEEEIRKALKPLSFQKLSQWIILLVHEVK
jgi:hypothetical protein